MFDKFKCIKCNCKTLQRKNSNNKKNQCFDCSNDHNMVRLSESDIRKLQPTPPYRRGF